MFINFRSVMTWGIWILSLFIPIAFLYALVELMHVYPQMLAWARGKLRLLPETLPYRGIKTVLCSIGMVLAVGTAVYTGVLLSVVEAVPLWATPILPILFLVSAVSTGMGLCIDLAATLTVPDVQSRFKNLPAVHIGVIVLEVALLGLLLYTAYNQGGEAAASVELIVSGPGAAVFWVLVIGFGMLYPLLVHGYALIRHKHNFVSSILAGVGIVIAGLFVRYLIVAAAVPLTL
jgi:formate-dependent nitrite reductase membrane component NrfD